MCNVYQHRMCMQHKHKWLSNNASFTLSTNEVCWVLMSYTSHESWCVGKIDVQDVEALRNYSTYNYRGATGTMYQLAYLQLCSL